MHSGFPLVEVAYGGPPASAACRKRPKLLFVVTRMDLGGVPEHIMILLDHLAARYEITIACREVIPEHRERIEATGTRIVLIHLARTPNPLRDIRALFELVSFIRREGFDIVHSHMSKGALIGGIAGWLSRAPVVLNTAHNFGWLAIPNALLRRVFWLYDKLLFALTLDRLVTISRLQEQQIVATRLVSRNRVTTVLNGIDVGALAAKAARGSATRAELGIPADAVLVITVARLVWLKAVDQLVEAVALMGERAANAVFIVVGEGTDRPALERLIEKRGLIGRVRLLGGRLDVPRLLSLADIFALPSVSEGMPIAIMEAMATGLPVVATAVDGTPEVVEDGKTGLLVPPRDPAALAAAIGKLIAEPGLRKDMGRKGRRRIEQSFSDRSLAAGMDALYTELLARKVRGARGGAG